MEIGKRPNIVMITTDQQRYDTIAAAGYKHMKTPNLDRLMQEGCYYTNAYSPNPACIPARHCILTGLSAKYHGFDDNYFDCNKSIPYQLPTFAQILSDSGYDTMAIGKMHFQPARRHNGFQHLKLMEEIPRYREDDEYAIYLNQSGYGEVQSIHGVRHLLYMLPQRSLVPEENHGSTWVADQTIEYLGQNEGKRPFLLWSSFIQPHPPFDVPEGWADLYRGVKLPEIPESMTPLSPLAQENKWIADYPDEKYLRRVRELYYASISFVDYQIGRILRKLEDIGELDNTLVIFTSDHGELLGDYGTYQKFLPYDGSAKIPFLVRYPRRVEAGSCYEEFVDLNDILPTILDAAGISYPDDRITLPGESVLLPPGQGRKNRQYQYVEYCRGNRRWISLRNRAYKYNFYYGGGEEELFDMKNDPHETLNLLYDRQSRKSYEEIRISFKKQLVDYEERYGLDGYIEEHDFIRLPPYEAEPRREMNFPMFPNTLAKSERAETMLSYDQEILKAVKREPVVQLKDLDLSTFQIKSGLSGQVIQHMIDQQG